MCLKTHPTNEPSILPSVHPHIHQRNPTKVPVCLGLYINCLFAERRGDSFISRNGVFKGCILGISQSPFHGSIEMTGFCPMSEKRSDEDRSWQEEPISSKNEMLYFVQHDKFLHTVILRHEVPKILARGNN